MTGTGKGCSRIPNVDLHESCLFSLLAAAKFRPGYEVRFIWRRFSGHLATNSVQICLGVTGTGEGVRGASLPADADLAFAHTSWWMTGLDGIRVPAS